jgi:hypothetical protein
VTNGNVFIAGRDDPKIDPAARIRRSWWGAHKFEHATLYGVYTFLERAAGVRFYFADELLILFVVENITTTNLTYNSTNTIALLQKCY